MSDEKMRLIRARNGNRARFQRRGIHEKKRLADVWRKPKGRHNKLRRQIKAKGPLPRPGYGSPAAVRGLHPCGLEDILVATGADLAGLKPKLHAVRIAAGVGARKKREIQKQAAEAGLKVLNPMTVKAVAEEQEKEPEEPEDEVDGDE